MTLETIGKAQLADEIGLLTLDGDVSERAVADQFRRVLARWGLSSERDVTKYVRDQLTAVGIRNATCVPKVLRRLQDLRELDRVYVAREPYIAPSKPCWVPIGERAAAFLGVKGPPTGIQVAPSENPFDIVQRINVESDEEATQLHLAGAQELSLAEWFSPSGLMVHAARRLRRPARSDQLNLGKYWSLLEELLSKEGLPLSPDAEIRTLTGEPGKFFGRYDSAEPEGRWTEAPPEGVWCAFRRGYGETHWHPTIISVDTEMRRAMDLYDHDEWRWALLARGKELAMEEVIHVEENSVRLTFPPPTQLQAALNLLGSSYRPWTWELESGAPDVRQFIH